jgi:hypothetical protein
MSQVIDPALLPMRDEIVLLDKIAKAAKLFGRETKEIMEAAKLTELRRIADALERLAPPPKPITPSHDDADQWDDPD